MHAIISAMERVSHQCFVELKELPYFFEYPLDTGLLFHLCFNLLKTKENLHEDCIQHKKKFHCFDTIESVQLLYVW